MEELLGAGELWIDHKKDIFFPRSSAATCTNRPLEANQRYNSTGSKYYKILSVSVDTNRDIGRH
ncbi:hypothetical protein Taro_012366 [Colocasia esculenta]|uniref:Uncharacterized protein n=1 Tax=Colocasia esculenta TaxID=4460 RepID=A0A843UDD0_COLES|nr:hypothetical protein [Colocasia esculenta]